ncbi:MAG: ImmA/IrrE family metallo-endopeptidase, partial [Planctomycetes bacterium]|nr:ImmA/IrrE family metallo-endopeptidase [Planctomycetota bacterium]
IAKRLKIAEERLLAWESGARHPTLKQIEALAHLFHRPLGVFFLPQPPSLPPLAAEYRRLPGVRPGEESPEFRLAVRQMLTRRENGLNLMGELGEPVPEFGLRAYVHEHPAEVGARLRAAMGVDVETQCTWPDGWRAWNTWRSAVERLGVLVFQFARVEVAEVRGLALLKSPLPVAAINSKEIPEAKLYTLFHEIVHLMLAAGREESPASEERRPAAEWSKVERFAEAAASHALIPEAALQARARDVARHDETWTINRVQHLASKFRVTPKAMATRLRISRFLTRDEYERWCSEWDAHVKSLPPRRGGIATPAQEALSRAGRPFTQLVLEALSTNRITSVDASRHLDLKFEHFEKLRLLIGGCA